MQVQSQTIPWRALELRWSIKVVLNWAEIVESLCPCLDQSLDVSHSWKSITLGKVAICLEAVLKRDNS